MTILRVLFLALVLGAVVAQAIPMSLRNLQRNKLGEDESDCTRAGGQCQDKNTQVCHSGYIAGVCPGAANVQCCGGGAPNLPAAAAAAPAKPASGLPHPPPTDAGCVAKAGHCMDVTKAKCSGAGMSLHKGVCPGDANQQCCVEKAAPAAHTPAAPAKPAAASSHAATPAITPSTGAPHFDQLRSCYPQGEPEDVKKRLGGAIDAAWITNTCAIRMSHTLNCVGHKVPAIDNEHIVGKAPEKWNYIFRVKQLAPVLHAMFGAGVTIKSKAAEGHGVNAAAIQGKKGILYFDTEGVWADATGHFDLWDGSLMVENSHANIETVTRYFSIAKSITFWAMP